MSENMSKERTAKVQRVTRIDESNIMRAGPLRIARILRGGETQQQAMDFARSRGREPTKADIKRMSIDECFALGDALSCDGWARLKDKAPRSTKEQPLFLGVGAWLIPVSTPFGGGALRWGFIYINVTPESKNPSYVIWVEQEAASKVAQMLRKKDGQTLALKSPSGEETRGTLL